MESVGKVLDGTVGWVCVVLLAVMTILVAFQVVVGYLFNSPNAHTEPLSKYMFVWMAMYGSVYVSGLWEHMNIGSVRDHTPSKTRVVVEMLGKLTIALFAAGVMIFGDYRQVTSQMIQIDTALRIPMGIAYSAVPVSAHFILLYLIYNGMKLAEKLREIQE